MDPTLTLTIPLLLLSRTDILDPSPSTHNPASTTPLSYLHATLTQYCPQTPIRLAIPPPSSSPESPNAGETWLLSPTEPSPRVHEIPVHANVHISAFSLKRTCIPLASTSLSYKTFVAELQSLFAVLHAMHNLRGVWPSISTGTDVRLWSIIAPHNTFLEIRAHGLNAAVVRNVVMLAAGVEREVINCSVLGKGVVSSQIEKVVREKGMGDVEARVRRTRGRRAEWFDVVRGMGFGDLRRVLGDGDGGACELADEGSVRLGMHRATFEAEEILWYTELVAGLVGVACECDGEACVEWLEEYRDQASSPPCPKSGLGYLAKYLRIPAPPASYLDAEFEVGKEEDEITNPFWKFETHVEKEKEHQRAYMPVFIERYEEAGGFWPTSESKIEELRRAEGWKRLNEGKEKDMKMISRSVGVGVEEVQGDADGNTVETSQVKERDEELKMRVLEWL